MCFAVGELTGLGSEFMTNCVNGFRASEGKKPTPTVAIIDSNQLKPQKVANNEIIDCGKKITGRKRHIAVGYFGTVTCRRGACCGVFKITKGPHFVLHRIKDKFRRLGLCICRQCLWPLRVARLGTVDLSACAFNRSPPSQSQGLCGYCQNDGLLNEHLHG